MTITQLIQSSPANANELFAKLASTSNAAVKTRESLFNQLKEELELHARLEEEHLFPVLRKHKETKDLVREALSDNKRSRALLAVLEEIPKDTDDFASKVSELQKAFQQHVRDEKKELLPAVKAALSNEEAQAIAQRVEADKSSVEQAKRQEAEERRAAARQEREEAERREAQAEARRQRARDKEKERQAEIRAEERRVRAEERRKKDEAEAEQRRAREAGRALARTGIALVTSGPAVGAAGAAAAQMGAEAAVQNSQAVAGTVTDAIGQAGETFANSALSFSERAKPAIERMEVLVSLPPLAARAAAETGKIWFEAMSLTAESSGRTSRDLMRSFTPYQVAEAHARYFGETRQAWSEANTRILNVSMGTYRAFISFRDPAQGRTDQAT